MQNLYADIIAQKKQKKFFQTTSQNKVINYLKEELSLADDEAVLFTIIFSYMLEEGDSCRFEKIKDDFDIKDSQYIHYLSMIQKLEKKGYLSIEKEYRRSRQNKLEPVIYIDDTIFNRLIFGSDILDDINFSDIFSITEVISELLDKKDDDKLSEARFYDEFARIVKKIDKEQKFFRLFAGYQTTEQLTLFICIKEYLDGYNGESASHIAKMLHDKLSKRSKFVEKLLKKELKIFKDGLVKLEEKSGLFDTSTDVKLSDKAISILFDSKKKVKKSFSAKYSTYLSYKKLNKKLFLDGKVSCGLDQITNVADPKRFKKITKELKKANLSSGLVSLFYGYPGTGKTASVYEMAKKTKRDVLQVDLSAIQSKWVGESEKNTRAIFDEYKKAKKVLKHEPILLFNEADGLLSKRFDVTNSVGQMHNTMQNILLEELENFEGIFIATTNLTDNLDDAFSRRFLHKLEFEKPGNKIKKKIWKAKLPKLTDYMIDEVSKYDLSGGQIENVAKKYMLETILHEKELCLEELVEYCESEVCFKQEQSGNKMGFLKPYQQLSDNSI